MMAETQRTPKTRTNKGGYLLSTTSTTTTTAGGGGGGSSCCITSSPSRSIPSSVPSPVPSSCPNSPPPSPPPSFPAADIDMAVVKDNEGHNNHKHKHQGNVPPVSNSKNDHDDTIITTNDNNTNTNNNNNKKIGIIGGISIAVNALAGPAILQLPYQYQRSGIIPTTLCVIFVGILSTCCCSYIVKVIHLTTTSTTKKSTTTTMMTAQYDCCNDHDDDDDDDMKTMESSDRTIKSLGTATTASIITLTTNNNNNNPSSSSSSSEKKKKNNNNNNKTIIKNNNNKVTTVTVVVPSSSLEYSDIFGLYWGRTAYRITQILFFACTICLNIAAIIDTATVVDIFFGYHFNSYAITTTTTSVPINNSVVLGAAAAAPLNVESWSYDDCIQQRQLQRNYQQLLDDGSLFMVDNDGHEPIQQLVDNNVNDNDNYQELQLQQQQQEEEEYHYRGNDGNMIGMMMDHRHHGQDHNEQSQQQRHDQNHNNIIIIQDEDDLLLSCSEPFYDTNVYGKYLLTLGYIVAAAFFIPICLMDLKENTSWQIFGFITLITLSSYFCYDFLMMDHTNETADTNTTTAVSTSGKDDHDHEPNVTWWGEEWGDMVGIIMFNYCLVLAIPAWLNEKDDSVSANMVVMSSTAIAICLYIGVGIAGAVAIPNAPVNMLYPMISGAYGTTMQISSSCFAFFIIGLDIPLMSVLTRYNLLSANGCNDINSTTLGHKGSVGDTNTGTTGTVVLDANACVVGLDTAVSSDEDDDMVVDGCEGGEDIDNNNDDDDNLIGGDYQHNNNGSDNNIHEEEGLGSSDIANNNNNNMTGKYDVFMANCAVVYIPWLLSWLLYQGNSIGVLLDWGGILLTGFIAFILPLALAVHVISSSTSKSVLPRSSSSSSLTPAAYSLRSSYASIGTGGDGEEEEDDDDIIMTTWSKKVTTSPTASMNKDCYHQHHEGSPLLLVIDPKDQTSTPRRQADGIGACIDDDDDHMASRKLNFRNSNKEEFARNIENNKKEIIQLYVLLAIAIVSVIVAIVGQCQSSTD